MLKRLIAGQGSNSHPISSNGDATPLNHFFVICFQLMLLALLYGQTSTFDYVYYDDNEYVLVNAPVLAGLTLDSIHWAFTSFYMSNWHPLTWLSHMLDVTLFGTDSGWAHLHNAALHGINSLLVYALLFRLSGNWWKSCLLSVIFLAHPLHVESVAWIAERKDLLSALFFLLGLLLYDSYRTKARALLYIGVLICFILALLAKPMAVTFPAVLLMLDFFVYPRCFQPNTAKPSALRFDYYRAIREKVPFIALSAASCVVTLIAQDAGNSVVSLNDHTIISRASTAAVAYTTYLHQWLVPTKLAAFYPLNHTPSLWDATLPIGILLIVAVVIVVYARRLPFLAAGLCWFVITLLPVIGLVQVGSQAHADRYMYLPSVGLLIACIHFLPARDQRHFQFSSVLAIIFISYLSVLCFWQISYWNDRHTLFSRALDVSGPNYLSHIMLAADYMEKRNLKEAKHHSQSAVKLRPDHSAAYMTLGNIAAGEGDLKEAEAHYREAISRGFEYDINHAITLNNLGIVIAEQGNIAEGIRVLEEALKAFPDSDQIPIDLQNYRQKLEHPTDP